MTTPMSGPELPSSALAHALLVDLHPSAPGVRRNEREKPGRPDARSKRRPGGRTDASSRSAAGLAARRALLNVAALRGDKLDS